MQIRCRPSSYVLVTGDDPLQQTYGPFQESRKTDRATLVNPQQVPGYLPNEPSGTTQSKEERKAAAGRPTGEVISDQ